MTIAETRNLAIEFERRIQQIYPNFNLKEKLTSDVIYSMLNEYQNTYFKTLILADDQDKSGTRQQRLVDDSIAVFIKSDYIPTEASTDTYYFDEITSITPTVTSSIPFGSTNVKIGEVKFFTSINNFLVAVSYNYGGKGYYQWFKIKDGRAVDSLGLIIYGIPELDAKCPRNSIASSQSIYVCASDNVKYTCKGDGKTAAPLVKVSDEATDYLDKYTNVFNAPSDYYAYIRSSSVLSKSYKKQDSYDENSYPIVPNIQVKHNEIVAVFDTIYNSGGIIKNPLLVQHGSKFHVVCDRYTKIVGLNLQYYRKPNSFSLTVPCEFPIRCFDDLVQGAVDMYISDYKFKLVSGGSQRREPQKQTQETEEAK